jgi:hypothetical protein
MFSADMRPFPASSIHESLLSHLSPHLRLCAPPLSGRLDWYRLTTLKSVIRRGFADQFGHDERFDWRCVRSFLVGYSIPCIND